jgi:hypothetical protein
MRPQPKEGFTNPTWYQLRQKSTLTYLITPTSPSTIQAAEEQHILVLLLLFLVLLVNVLFSKPLILLLLFLLLRQK